MAYPSTYTTFNYPSSSDRLNNPSHSALENSQSSTIGQIQAVIGLAGDSSTLGTIIGDLRSPSSGGGGHVQTVNKGGTGFTSYTKGDLLVATSSSVLAKVAVSSTTGEVLTVDTTQATGIKWAAAGSGTKITISNSVVNVRGGQGSVNTILFAASIAGSLLGTTNGVRYRGVIQQFASDQGPLDIVVTYGQQSIAAISIPVPASVRALSGTLEGTLVANNSSVAQLNFTQWSAKKTVVGSGTFVLDSYGTGYGGASVNSSANRDLIITSSMQSGTNYNSILTGFFVVEKIT